MTAAKTRVLLADDHALVRAGLRDALTQIEGMEIVGEATNGPDVIAGVDVLTPDLLVLDVNMPDFEPVAAVSQLRGMHPQLKILVVSAYDDQSYVVGLLAAGVNGYHLKDQSLSDFHLAVRRVLEGGRWISDPLVSQLLDHSTAPADVTVSLTRRQRELLYYLNQGYNNQRIARVMNLSIKTVENHLTALYRAIGAESRLEANRFATLHPELLTPPDQEKPHRRSDTAATEELTVLLVDDNPRYRAQLGRLVMRACPTSRLYEVDDTDEACRIAEQIRPRLAFIDVVLRDEDGIQAARQIHAISPGTRLVLISAYPDWGFRIAGNNAGASAFLDKKDIDAPAVRQLVEDVLDCTVCDE